jgi:hypothetical protein
MFMIDSSDILFAELLIGGQQWSKAILQCTWPTVEESHSTVHLDQVGGPTYKL